MKKLLILLLISNFCFAQFGKKKYEAAMEKLKVSTITIEEGTFKVGDTLTIGFPYGQREKFSFLMRKIDYNDYIIAMPDIETLKLDIGFTNRNVVITNLYYDKSNPQLGVSAEFLIIEKFFGMITLGNAIKAKEVIKLNGKSL